jgi:hypothetical protein
MANTFANMSPTILTALVAAVAAIVVALINTVVALRGQRALRIQQEEIATLTDKFQRRRSRSEAWMEYQFEARRRLYDQCEPLFFQLADASDYALRKCHDLAKPHVWKELEPRRENLDAQGHWMLCDSTELIATAHALFTPIVVFCLLRERMTQVDFSLDRGVWFRYLLARQLYETFQDDFVLAAIEPRLKYDPLTSDWRKKRLENPAIYWWQGISRGRLERAVHHLTVEGSTIGTRRVINFGEFEDFYRKVFRSDDLIAQKTLGIACNPLYHFTLPTRPVFWRIFIAQIHLHCALRRPPPSDIASLAADAARMKKFLRLENYREFDWLGCDSHTGSFFEPVLDYLAVRLAAPLKRAAGTRSYDE